MATLHNTRQKTKEAWKDPFTTATLLLTLGPQAALTLGSAAWAVTLDISGKQRAPVLGDSASRWLSAEGVVEQLRPEPRPWGVDSA